MKYTSIWTWNTVSEGASELAAEMGIKKIKHENSNFRGASHKVVINWGSSTVPDEVRKCRIINPPEVVSLCSDKLKFFNKVSDELLPPWTTDFNTAVEWVAAGHVVCARTILNGHSAAGLIIMEKDDPSTFVRAPLYTRYIPKKDEYRIHVVGNSVIDVQRKALKAEKANSGEEINWKVRNLDNGFIYQRENINVPDAVKDVATRAVKEVGLTFGAVDVVVNTKDQRPYVLEINSAPGITGTTVQNYAKALALL